MRQSTGLLSRLASVPARFKRWVAFCLDRPHAHQNLLLRAEQWGRIATESLRATLLASERYSDPRRLTRHGYKVFSQYDEDGLLDEVFRRIGIHSQYFVEFGVGDGLENNTAYRLACGWRGVWLEGNPAFCKAIGDRLSTQLSTKRLQLEQAFITPDNIAQLFDRADVPDDFDLMSIDLDGNDYWVWENLVGYRPRVVMAEYNAAFGPVLDWVMPRNDTHVWRADRLFGAS
jgi:hypothetical protein